MKLKIKGFACKNGEKEELEFWGADPDFDWIDVITPVDIEVDVEIPADFNQVSAKVQKLTAQLDGINDAHMREVMRIKSKLAELTSIENKVTA